MWKRLTLILVVALVAVISFVISFGCTRLEEQRRASEDFRTLAFDRAAALYPLPFTENFPLRQALVEFTRREDLINHKWYTYVLGDNGNTLGYYVSKTPPINSCDFLSSTESINGGTAPSLDGLFYGGGGAAAGCDEWFFFDWATDALIKIRGVHFYTADQPLYLQAEPITIQQVPVKP